MDECGVSWVWGYVVFAAVGIRTLTKGKYPLLAIAQARSKSGKQWSDGSLCFDNAVPTVGNLKERFEKTIVKWVPCLDKAVLAQGGGTCLQGDKYEG